MIEGRLGYNISNDRYGILISDLWENDGLHCGEVFEVLIDDEWRKERIEFLNGWYLVYSRLKGEELEYLRVRYKSRWED